MATKKRQYSRVEGHGKKICGIVMPISAIDGCPESHWADVLGIVSETVEDAGFEPNLVSNAEEVGFIQKRIIQNLYDNPVVVCDVSGKNPNVMFELGLRLAFDKPTIIIKDDKTSYSFDTAPIEHLQYPRDLRFSLVVEFKKKLSEKISATFAKATSDPSYTTFLKHFGEFTIAKLDKKEVSGQEFILEELKNIRSMMLRLGRSQVPDPRMGPEGDIDVCLGGVPDHEIARRYKLASENPAVSRVWINLHGDHKHLIATLKPDGVDKKDEVRDLLDVHRRSKRVMVKRKAMTVEVPMDVKNP